MKVRVLNVPVRGYTTVEVEVDQVTQDEIQHALRELPTAKFARVEEAELDVRALDSGWEFTYQEVD